ncbi:INO80 complex subunit E isoform X2 [Tetranychus urticae]|uniref:INO80 complex subunit E isoform X2 n=1 Tax=Tetranychus urticae TaxID=32264 RepID=UPI00077BA5C6|nr:INO80 complex subunit E isoform X2 [Tetranychus urticae]
MSLMSEESESKSSHEQKQVYRDLKRKLKLLIYENEYYQEELRKYQKELLIINRDKNFLMDKLLQYENISTSSSDSDDTDSSESGIELRLERSSSSANRRRRLTSSNSETAATKPKVKRKRINSNGAAPTSPHSSLNTYAAPNRNKNLNAASSMVPQSTLSTIASGASTISSYSSTFTANSLTDPIFNCSSLSQQIKSEFPIRTIKSEPLSILSLGRVNGGHLTSEEIERHFESRPSLLLPEKTPLTVPVELFSNESSLDLPDSNIKSE